MGCASGAPRKFKQGIDLDVLNLIVFITIFALARRIMEKYKTKIDSENSLISNGPHNKAL